MVSSSGESGAFWTVQQFTTGQDNQSTEWLALSDPFPFYVGQYKGESECPNDAGSPCTVTLKAPSNASYGDVFIVALTVGANIPASAITIPKGWQFLKMSNSGIYRTLSSDPCGSYVSGFLLAYVYGSAANDSGSYNFTYTPFWYNVCGGQLLGELGPDMLLAYRGASQNFANYTAWGYGFSNDVSKVTTNSCPGQPSPCGIVPPAETTLLNIFLASGPEEESSDVTFSAPQGQPPLTVETNSTTLYSFLAADVPVASSITFGPCSVSDGWTGPSMAWQLAIPEP